MSIRAAEVQTPALVYLRSMRGPPEAQKWWQPVSDHARYWEGKILAWHPLDGATAGLPFHKLREIFPPPKQEDIV
jgi:hypothetical protein